MRYKGSFRCEHCGLSLQVNPTYRFFAVYGPVVFGGLLAYLLGYRGNALMGVGFLLFVACIYFTTWLFGRYLPPRLEWSGESLLDRGGVRREK